MTTAAQTFNILYIQEDKTWLSTLNFYEEEIHQMEHLLSQVLPNHIDSQEFIAWTKYFQEQFEKQVENINSIKKAINQHIDLQIYENQFQDILQEKEQPSNHLHIRTQVFTFEKLFLALKHEFYNFLGKYFT